MTNHMVVPKYLNSSTLSKVHRLKISSNLSSVQQVRALYSMHAGRVVATRNTSRNLPVLPIAFLVGIVSWSVNCIINP